MAVAIGSVLCLSAAWLSGDEVQMKGGDRYVGEVLSLNTNTLVLRSDVLGTLRLPRSKVAVISLGGGVSTNSPQVAPDREKSVADLQAAPGAAAPVGASGALGLLGSDKAVGTQIQAQLLGADGAEANAKFREMVSGYLTGKLTVNDIRNQAQAAAEQLREFKREMGPDADATLDAYLSVLDRFLGQTTNSAPTNPPASRPPAKAKTPPDQERP